MAEKDTMEIVCEAIEIIVKNRVDGLSFDKTIQCTVIDDSNSSEGEYVVSDGSVSFKAYSENTKYRNNNHVYVTIPMGDFNQKKIITGRYVSSDSESVTWVSPMESFVELAAIGSWSGDAGLVANEPRADKPEKGTMIHLGDWDVEPGLIGYDRLGVSADFRTYLQQFKTIKGNYGLVFSLLCEEATTAEGQQETIKTTYHTLFLDSSDMWGNPYNFEGWFTQEKVWDISSLGVIKHVSVDFYQAKNFLDNEENAIAWSFDGSENGRLPENIFVNNLKISVGHNLEDMTEDKIYLVTYNSKTYRARPEGELDNNKKEVHLRWVHKVNDKFVVIDSDEDLKEYVSGENYETRTAFFWYRKVLENEVTDEYAGNFWRKEQLNKDTDFWQDHSITEYWKRTVSPDITLPNEKIKVIIRTTDWDAAQEAEAAWEQAQKDYEKDSADYKKAEKAYQEAMAEAVTFYNSEELEFTNESNTEKQNVDLVQALKLTYDEKDAYKGIYRIYDGNTKKVLTPRESQTNRKLIAEYKSLVTGETFLDGTGAESITWRIPLNRTMIQEPVEKVSFTEEEAKDKNIVWKDDNYLYIKRTVPSALDEKGEVIEGVKNPELVYRIKDYWSPEYNNNTIHCEIVKNNLTYTADATLVFGISGTMGTDYTIDLRITDEVEFDADGNEVVIERSVAAVRADMARSRWVKIEAKLYDHENKPVENTSFSWKWFNRNKDADWHNQNTKSAFIFKSADTTGPVNYIQWKEDAELNGTPLHTVRRSTENILEISTKVKDSISYDLKAYLPIPSKMDASVGYLEGATTIIYNSSGSNPEWYKKSYVLHHNKTIKEGEQIIINIKPGFDETPTGWAKKFNKENFGIEYPFRPGVDNTTQTIKPGPMYINDISMIYWVLVGFKKADSNSVDENKVLWSQPLYIGQNLYESSILNQWDGNLTIDENNGTILSTMVGAGKKNSDNTFSGVLMGDVSKTTGLNKTGIGLYGYHQGAQSFGLNIDGTAFFGKAGKGRINLNGNKATLESADYATNKDGMIIDLDDGFIKTKNWQINTDGSAVFKNIKASNGTGNSSLDWGNGFSVDTNGILTANGCHINGDGTFTGTITATAGNIGGCLIENGTLKVGNANITSLELDKLTLDGNPVVWKSVDLVSWITTWGTTVSIPDTRYTLSADGTLSSDTYHFNAVRGVQVGYKTRTVKVLSATNESSSLSSGSVGWLS